MYNHFYFIKPIFYFINFYDLIMVFFNIIVDYLWNYMRNNQKPRSSVLRKKSGKGFFFFNNIIDWNDFQSKAYSAKSILCRIILYKHYMLYLPISEVKESFRFFKNRSIY